MNQMEFFKKITALTPLFIIPAFIPLYSQGVALQTSSVGIMALPILVYIFGAIIPALIVYISGRSLSPKFKGRFGLSYIGALLGGISFGFLMGLLGNYFEFFNDIMLFGMLLPLWSIVGSFAGATFGYCFNGKPMDQED